MERLALKTTKIFTVSMNQYFQQEFTHEYGMILKKSVKIQMPFYRSTYI